MSTSQPHSIDAQGAPQPSDPVGISAAVNVDSDGLPKPSPEKSWDTLDWNWIFHV